MFPRSQNLLKVLKNILLCSFYRLTGKLKYPVRILPKTYYKNLIDIDTLIGGQNVFFLRRSDESHINTFTQLGDTYILRDDFFGNNEIPNLSINLLGGRYKTKHAKYKLDIHSEAALSWDGESAVFLSDHLNNYSIVKEFSTIYIDSTNIHDVTIPYGVPENPHYRKLLSAFGKDSQVKNGRYHVEGKIKFVPAPTNLNYWHCELKIFDFGNEVIEYKSVNWVKELCGQIIKDVIIVNSYSSISSLTPIKSKIYKNSLLSD